LQSEETALLKGYSMAYVRTKEMRMVEAKKMHVVKLRNTPTNRLCTYFRAKVLLGVGLKKSLKGTSRNTPVSFKHFKSRFITSTSLSQIPILSSGFMY
jgi:hypothetical protein